MPNVQLSGTQIYLPFFVLYFLILQLLKYNIYVNILIDLNFHIFGVNQQ